MNKARIGLFAYEEGLSKEHAKEAATFLRNRGYDAECVDDISKLSSFGVALIHPGVKNQKKAMSFYIEHPEIRIAILTPSPEDYVQENDIPIISYSIESLLKFLEHADKKNTFKQCKRM